MAKRDIIGCFAAPLKHFLNLAIFLCANVAMAEVAPLPRANIDSGAITVSGVSAGAFMAVQLQVAYSKIFSGSGSIAGGVYWCAQGNLMTAEMNCIKSPALIDVAAQVAQAQKYQSEGSIDALENLRRQNIYIYASPRDDVVNPASSDKLEEFLRAYVPNSRFHIEHGISSAHGFPTLGSGVPCDHHGSPWILNCHYDAAGEILRSMYGSLKPRGRFLASHLVAYSQVKYPAEADLYSYGWAYIPDNCSRGYKCKLHVALHGCSMNPDDVQDQFVRLAGYNEWAETNDIVVLYPQAAKLPGINPFGCFDWFGVTGQNYATQSGPQMAAIMQMIAQLSKIAK